MESPSERRDRIARLEASRAERRGNQAASMDRDTVWPNSATLEPTEINLGRGDLNVTTRGPFGGPIFPALGIIAIGNRPISYARLFATQPWIAAAVMRLLTWAIRVPLKLYRRTGDDPADRQRLRVGDHPLADAFAGHGEMSGAELTMNMLGPLLVHGNSVTYCQPGEVTGAVSMIPKDWRFVRPLMPTRDILYGFTLDVDQPQFKVNAGVDEVLHICYWSPYGPLGVSPLHQLGVTLQIEDAAQRFMKGVFAHGARPPSAIAASPEFLGLRKEERQQILEQLREDLTSLYVGPENAGRPVLLPPGLTWQSVGSSSVEAELMDQRRVAREEIAAVYQIPPPMMGILDKATFANIKTQKESTYTDSLGPPLALIEQAINTQIVWGLLQEPDLFVEYDFGAVLRGDRLEEMNAIREAISTAVMTPNEGRSILQMSHSQEPGMDKFYIPSNNLSPIGSPPMPQQVMVPTAPPPPEPTGYRRGARIRSDGTIAPAFTEPWLPPWLGQLDADSRPSSRERDELAVVGDDG